jgi:leucine dehydrogenase
VCDVNNEKTIQLSKHIKCNITRPDKIYDVDADIFSPNALGGIVNDDTIRRLKAEIIAGGANNQLKTGNIHGQQLSEKDILYAPDYVINAGGLISVANEVEGHHPDITMQQVSAIYNSLLNIFSYSAKEKVLPQDTADIIAEKRLNGKNNDR